MEKEIYPFPALFFIEPHRHDSMSSALSYHKPGILATELCTHVGNVDSANEKFLRELPGNSNKYTCTDYFRGNDDGVLQKKISPFAGYMQIYQLVRIC